MPPESQDRARSHVPTSVALLESRSVRAETASPARTPRWLPASSRPAHPCLCAFPPLPDPATRRPRRPAPQQVPIPTTTACGSGGHFRVSFRAPREARQRSDTGRLAVSPDIARQSPLTKKARSPEAAAVVRAESQNSPRTLWAPETAAGRSAFHKAPLRTTTDRRAHPPACLAKL